MAKVIKTQGDEEGPPSDRLYYRIGEVSRMTGLKPHVLRYWESEFRVIKPYKAGSLQRLYRKRDLEIIQTIKKLLYEEGFTIAGARKKIRDLEGEEETEGDLRSAKARDKESRELLQLLREELTKIREMLE